MLSPRTAEKSCDPYPFPTPGSPEDLILQLLFPGLFLPLNGVAHTLHCCHQLTLSLCSVLMGFHI